MAVLTASTANREAAQLDVAERLRVIRKLASRVVGFT